MAQELSPEERTPLYLKVGTYFRPSTPIDGKELFSGRLGVVSQVIDTLYQDGQHAVIYGERGVGKTSLVRTLADFVKDVISTTNQPRTIISPHVDCDGTDNFSRLWMKIFSRIDILTGERPMGFNALVDVSRSTISGQLQGIEVTPDIVVRVLSDLSKGALVFVVLDEFDRLKDSDARRLIADTIKALSDYNVQATLLIVGVGDNVGQLISEHNSIGRNLVQIPLPRMSKEELETIVKKAAEGLGMEITSSALERIVSMSRGLPNYTHALGLHAFRNAIQRGTRGVEESDINSAIAAVLAATQQSVRDAVTKAVSTSKKNAIYADVLLACALTKAGDVGYFSAGDVRDPLNKLTGKSYGISNYVRHLNEFCGDQRGKVLQCEGQRYQRRYRFSESLFQPFIIMEGIRSGRLKDLLLSLGVT